MSGTKNTPGPWAVRVEEQHYVPSAEGRIANVLFPRYYADGAEVMANARLISAAPELLEAMELLMTEVEESGNADAKDFGWPKAIKSARAAIAKAAGGDA